MGEVRWAGNVADGIKEVRWVDHIAPPVGTRLYTAPPLKRELTDEEIRKAAQDSGALMRGAQVEDAIDIVRAAIVVYKRKNEGPPAQDAVDAERWRAFLSTRPESTHEGINQAIDAAIAAQKGKP